MHKYAHYIFFGGQGALVCVIDLYCRLCGMCRFRLLILAGGSDSERLQTAARPNRQATFSTVANYHWLHAGALK